MSKLEDELRKQCRAAMQNGRQAYQKTLEDFPAPGKGDVERVAHQALIEELPRRIEAESAAGGHHLVIWDVPKDGWDVPPDLMGDFDEKDPGFLRELSRAIYETCERAGLKPALRFWADGSYGSGRAIFIHW